MTAAQLADKLLASQHADVLRESVAWMACELMEADVAVGIFPNDAALLRLAGTLLLEQNDEWLVGRRYLSESSMALVMAAGHPAGSTTTGTKQVAQLTTS
jgi:hypothetical protein